MRRYYDEGRIYGFYRDEENEKLDDSASFFHPAPLEKDRYIAVSLMESADAVSGISGALLLHEGAHDEMGDHSQEMRDYFDSVPEGESFDETEEFASLIEQEGDYCYLVSTLGAIPDQALMYARESKYSYSSSHWDYLEELLAVEASKTDVEVVSRTVSEYYDQAMADPLAQDQRTWATAMVDERGFGGREEAFEGLGLNREKLIEILSHETSIYPREHVEFLEQMAEFRWEHGLEMRENREMQMPRTHRR